MLSLETTTNHRQFLSSTQRMTKGPRQCTEALLVEDEGVVSEENFMPRSHGVATVIKREKFDKLLL